MIIGKFLTFKILAWIPLYFGIGMLTFMADKTRKTNNMIPTQCLEVPKDQTKIWAALPLNIFKYQKVKSKFGHSFPPLLKKSNQIGSQ